MINHLAVLLLATACTADPVGLEQTLWEATLIGTLAYPDFMGSAAAVSGANRTAISILVEGLPSGSTFAWRLRSGDCDNPGSVFSSEDAYPDLEIGESGSATTDIAISRLLSVNNTYHVAVLTIDPEPEPVACGNLIRR
ncbi:MAG: hypothetical protein GTN75_00710 [Gemmatimonadetes bacterium]|nr:hypothetical protein [Gemmatimonadota bacterium]